MTDEAPKPEAKSPQEKLEGLSNALGIPQIKQQLSELNETQNRILNELGTTNTNLHSCLQWIQDFTAKLNQAGGLPNQQASQQQQGQPGLMQMVQSGGISFKDVAETIKALRGTDQQPQNNEFAQLGQQLVTDLIRTVVDDVQQRVYNIKKLPPPRILSEASHALE